MFAFQANSPNNGPAVEGEEFMIRSLRIITGLVLFLYVATHLANLGFGLVSIEMMDRMRGPLMAPWSNLLGELALTASMLVHIVLGLRSLYLRGTLRMSKTDTVQFITALLIPPLLIPHIVGTMVAAKQFGILPSYAGLSAYFWIYEPLEGLRQVLVLVVTWVHGCVGLFTWLRIQSWWDRIAPYCYPLAVAIPVVALLGFVQAGNEAINPPEPTAAAGYEVEQTAEDNLPVSAPVTQEALDTLYEIRDTMIGIYLAPLALTLVARYFRSRRFRSVLQISYAKGPAFEHDTGLSLLEIATVHGVPHANLCRGRGRCGTCRVKILEAESELPLASDLEKKTLTRVHAPDGARLACQLVPGKGSIKVERLLPPYIQPEDIKKYQQDSLMGPDMLQSESA